MKHITTTQLADGYKRLVPDKGYVVANTLNDRTYSEVIVKDDKWFYAKKG